MNLTIFSVCIGCSLSGLDMAVADGRPFPETCTPVFNQNMNSRSLEVQATSHLVHPNRVGEDGSKEFKSLSIALKALRKNFNDENLMKFNLAIGRLLDTPLLEKIFKVIDDQATNKFEELTQLHAEKVESLHTMNSIEATENDLRRIALGLHFEFKVFINKLKLLQEAISIGDNSSELSQVQLMDGKSLVDVEPISPASSFTNLLENIFSINNEEVTSVQKFFLRNLPEAALKKSAFYVQLVDLTKKWQGFHYRKKIIDPLLVELKVPTLDKINYEELGIDTNGNWSQATTDPGLFDPLTSKFFAMGFSGNTASWIHRQVSALTVSLSGINISDEFWNSPDINPNGFSSKPIVAMSYIGPGRWKTMYPAGFLLKVPQENLLSIAIEDAGSFNYSEPENVKLELNNRKLPPPDELLDYTSQFRYNEIHAVGTHPDTGTKIAINGIFIQKSESDQVIVSKEEENYWIALAARLGVPVVYIPSNSSKVDPGNSRVIKRILQKVVAMSQPTKSWDSPEHWKEFIREGLIKYRPLGNNGRPIIGVESNINFDVNYQTLFNNYIAIRSESNTDGLDNILFHLELSSVR